MPRFKDEVGGDWNVKLDAPLIRKIRKELNVDLADREDTYNKLDADVCLLVDVLYVCCEDQCRAGNVTDIAFGKALVGDAIDRATEALLQAIDDFTPASKRSLPRLLAQKNAELRKKAEEIALAKVSDPKVEEELIRAMMERMDEDLENAVTHVRQPTSAPESSESAPTD